MNNQNSIVVYRSRSEQLQDEFIQENPEAVLGFLVVIVLVIVIYVFKNKTWK